MIEHFSKAIIDLAKNNLTPGTWIMNERTNKSVQHNLLSQHSFIACDTGSPFMILGVPVAIRDDIEDGLVTLRSAPYLEDMGDAEHYTESLTLEVPFMVDLV